MEKEAIKIFNKISYMYSTVVTTFVSIFGGEKFLFLGGLRL